MVCGVVVVPFMGCCIPKGSIELMHRCVVGYSTRVNPKLP